MPLLAAIWNIIKKLLNAEQQRSVLLVKKPQMPQYIERDQLFVHMGGSVSVTGVLYWIVSTCKGWELKIS